MTSRQSRAAERSSGFAAKFFILGALIMLTEGVLAGLPPRLLAAGNWIPQWLPFNLYLSEAYFILGGSVIATLSLLRADRSSGTRTPGISLLIILAIFYGLAAYRGYARENEAWLQDLRNLAFDALALPPFIWIARRINQPSVLFRLSFLGIPFAFLYAVAGFSKIAWGGFSDPDGLLYAHWTGGYVLLLLFLVACGRFLRKQRWGSLLAALYAGAILAPLNKPILPAFILAFLFWVTLLRLTIKRSQDLRPLRMPLAIMLIGVTTAITLALLLKTSGGFANIYLRERFLKDGHVDPDISGGRFDAWGFCLGQWLQEPLLGSGLGARAEALSRAGFTRTLPIHNLFIQTLTQAGLVGLVALAISLSIWFFRAIKSLRIETDPARYVTRLALLAFVTAVLAGAQYGEPLASPVVALSFWLAVAFETVCHGTVRPCPQRGARV